MTSPIIAFGTSPVEVPVEVDGGQVALAIAGYTIILTAENLRQLTAEAEASKVWEPVQESA